jgi:CarD family transcriptional regulator
MGFSVGDQVVHPKHGAGQITDTEQLELVKGFEHYYVIGMEAKDLIVRVPVRKMEELGVRPVMARSRLKRVLDTLRETPRQLSANYKTRQTRINEKLKTGRPLKIAEVVRDLTWHRRRKQLSETDSRLLNHGREFLATEIALVTDSEPAEARQTITDALTDTMTDNTAGQETVSSPKQGPQALSHCPTTGKPVKGNDLEHFIELDEHMIWWRCPACGKLHISQIDKH